MTSTDGEQGIRLRDFYRMWTDDGTKLIKQDIRRINGTLWLLFSVYFAECTLEYGRHMALLLKVDGKTKVILAHDLENMTGSAIDGGHRSIREWFDQHAGRY